MAPTRARRPEAPSETNHWQLAHAALLAESFERLLGRPLLPRKDGMSSTQAQALYQAPFVVVSHGVEEDPIFNYANLTAQRLFELDWDAFVQLESKHSAEPVEQAAREAFMQQVRSHGYIDDYTGIRISASGARFTIDNAVVWNVLDGADQLLGQAATFNQWTPL